MCKGFEIGNDTCTYLLTACLIYCKNANVSIDMGADAYGSTYTRICNIYICGTLLRLRYYYFELYDLYLIYINNSHVSKVSHVQLTKHVLLNYVKKITKPNCLLSIDLIDIFLTFDMYYL